MEHKMCLANCVVTKPHLGKVCVFFTNTVKVGAVTDAIYGMIIDYVFLKTLLILQF